MKLRKIGKTARLFRYDLNQIHNYYIVEVRHRFKGPDMTDRVPEEQWTEVHDIVQEAVIKTMPPQKKDHPQEKEMQTGKMAVWGGLTNS